MKTKICVCCGKVLPIDEFGNNRHSSDGKMVTCKSCTNKKLQEYRKRKRGVVAKADTTAKHLDDDGRNPDLAKFHARELIAELKARHYTGTIYYTQKTVF